MKTVFSAVSRACAALAAALVLSFSACNRAPAPQGAWDAANTDDCLPAVSLIDQNGNHLSLASLKGKPVLVDFIYTSCPGPCLTLTSKLVAVAEQLGPRLGQQVEMVSITLDPEHDSPQALKAFARRQDADRRGWRFLTGTPQQIESVLAAYKVRRIREADGSVTHTETLFLLGPDGHQRRIYNGVEVKPAVMSAEAEQLAARG
jgi:protein SCO1/2